jgi:hypothetical protein
MIGRARVDMGVQLVKGSDFGGFKLEPITKDNMFELRDLQGA